MLNNLIKDTSDNWNDGNLEINEVLQKFGELNNKVSKYKKSTFLIVILP